MAVCVLVALTASREARAEVDGTPPSPLETFRVFGDSLSIGNTLMTNVPSEPLVNAILLSDSAGTVRNVPTGSGVAGAYLFWSGSIDDDVGTDQTATLTLPTGATRTVRADRCLTTRAEFGGTGSVDFFYCRAEISDLLDESRLNGTYRVGGVTAMPGVLAPGGGCVESTCQAMYAGWSMVLVWESESETTLRDVSIFDGFQLFDETPVSAAIDTFTIGGFDVADPPEATYRFFGLEGDALLGVPPQDSDPVLRCTTCFDYVEINGTRLSDPINPAGNLFNSTLPEGSAIGIDIDAFDISDLVSPGDTSIRIEVGSGDGNPSTGHNAGAGGGELFFLGYNVVTINRLAPNFRTDATFMSVDPTEASPGEVIFYTIQVTNEGSLDATGVRVFADLPPNTEYVAGSTRVDGAAIADPGGAPPFLSGISLGTVTNDGDNDRRITFRLRVLPDTPNGTIIRNSARISANELDDDAVTNETQVVIVAPDILTPQKAWVDIDGGDVEPGDFVTYTITVRKDPDATAAGLVFTDDISRFAQLRSVNAGAFVDASALNGGANGTGLVRVEDITVARGLDRATFSYTVQILSAEELVAAGVDPSDIDGLLVSNQGTLDAEFLPAALRTDDPTTTASPDATDFRLTSSVNFRNAGTFKTATDVNGGALEPGDEVEFVISVRNTGSQSAQVDLVDDLPAGLTGAALAAPVPGVSFRAAPAGANGTGRVEAFGLNVAGGTTVTVRVRARVADDAPNGTIIRNIAGLTVPSFPSQSQDLTAPDLVVTSGPVFSDATKVAAGASGGFEPGDEVTWTITFSNQGNADATGVIVTDVVDSRFTAVTPLDGGSYNSGTRTITWRPSTIAVGASATVRFRARIAVTVPDGTTLSNQAFVSSADGAAFPTDDPSTAAVDDPTVIRVAALPALDTDKTVEDLGGEPFEPGDTVRYTIVVRNDGRADATNVTVVDPVPAALTSIAPGQGGAVAGNTVRWSAATTPALARIAPGGSVRLTVDAVLAADAGNGDIVTNQATIDADQDGTEHVSDDPTTADIDDPTRFTVAAEPILSTSTKTVVDDNGGAAQPGDLLTWRISVVNTGSGPARDIVVTDVVAPELVDITPDAGGRFDVATRTITWTPAAAVPAGGTLELSFRARVALGTANGTIVSNQATIESADTPATLTDDPTTAAVDDPTRITVESRPDFATSTKSVISGSADGEFVPGGDVLYTLVVRNTGTEDATNVVVRDPIDTGAFAEVEPDDGGVFDGSSVRWTLASLAAGEERTLAFRATLAFPLADSTVVDNQAFISTTGVAEVPTDDPTTAVDDDPTSFVVTSRPDLSTSIKTFVDSNGGSVRPGDRIEYVVLVINTGSETARNVVVTDVIDGALVDIDPGTGVLSGSTITWNASTNPGLAAVTVGDAGAVELRFSATVREPLDNGTRVSNQATLTAGDETFVTDDPTTAATSDPTSFQVISAFDFSETLKIVGASGPLGYRPGDEVRWTLVVANSGDAVARNVVVTDAIDPSLVFISATPGGVFDGTTLRVTSAQVPALAAIEPGEEVVIQVTTQLAFPLADGTTVANQAFVNADGGADPFPSDDPTTAGADDPTTITVSSAARLDGAIKSVEDVDGDGVFEPGDQVIYTITVSNDGDAPASDVSIVDPLPLDALGDIVVLDGGVFDGTGARWSAATTPALAQVDPGDAGAVDVRVRATLRSGLSDGTLVANQATVSATDLPGVPTDDPRNGLGDDDATSFRVVAQPRLDGATKAATDLNGGALESGDPVEYTLVIRNDGTEPARNVIVSDTIPAQLVDVEVLDGGGFDGATATWALGDLAAGDERTLRVRASVRGGLADGTEIRNQAFVFADELEPAVTDDPATDAIDDATVLVVNAEASYATSTKVAVDLNGGFVEPGDTVRFDITVINSGLAPGERVVVTDAVDTTLLTAIEPQQGGRFAGGTITWDAGSTPALAELAPGASLTVSFVARIADDASNGATIVNQGRVRDAAGVNAVTDDPSTAAPADATRLDIEFPELGASTKTVSDLNGGDVLPGDVLRYTITTSVQAGPALTAIAVSDPVDPSLGNVTPLDGGVFDAGSRTVTWNAGTTPALASVSPGSSVSVRFDATVVDTTASGTLIANQAVLTSAEVPEGVVTDDPSTPVEDDPTVVEVGGSAVVADLSGTTKTVFDVDGGVVEPDDVLRYTIVVPNDGSVPTRGLTLTDPAPALTAYVPNSLIVGGVPVAGDANPLATGLALGELAPGETIEITFDVRVDADAPEGALITNRAIASDEDGALAPSDDPTTPEIDDATVVVVGAVPDLSRTIKRVTPGDENGDGFVQAGESLLWTVEVTNRGPVAAQGVVIADDLAENTRYRAGTLVRDGVALTDAEDGDGGDVVGRRVRVDVGSLAPGATAVVSFRVDIASGARVANQAQVVWDGGQEPSDDDGDESNGNNPTVVVLDGAGSGLRATKSVADADGGTIEAGDELVYTLTFFSPDGTTAPLVVVDQPDGGVTLTEVLAASSGATATVLGDVMTVELEPMEAGETRTVVVRARLDDALADGDVVCNRLDGDLDTEVEPACVAIGGRQGVVELSGNVFRELGPRNGAFDADTDEPLDGFLVRAVRPDAGDVVGAEAATGADGRFELPALTPGAWELQAFANGGPDAGGALFARASDEYVSGDRRDVPLLVDPSGIIYDVSSLEPVGGVRVALVYDATEPTPGLAGERVDPARLGHPSQQDQIVPADGFYRFDVEPGFTYRLLVESAGTPWSFPSTQRAPEEGILDVRDRVDVVEQALPIDVAEDEATYWLRFDIEGEDSGVFNNHVPLDGFDSLVSLTKRADRTSAWVGDIVTYTITISNRSAVDLTFDEVTERGGAVLVDTIPRTFRYVDHSVVGALTRPDGSRDAIDMTATGTTILEMRAVDNRREVPLSIPAGGDLQVRYQLVIGSDTEPGDTYRNIAELRGADGSIVLSNQDHADVRVDYDPVFDQGVLIGKVFCDDNGDGRQQRGEAPLPGARVYLDLGAYTEVDSAGQYHFADIDPGLHLVKIDVNTLPPGSELTTDERRLFNVTRGVPTLIDFGVACAENRVTEIEVLPGDETLADAERRRRERYADVVGDIVTGALRVEGEDVAWLDAAIIATAGGFVGDAQPTATLPAPVEDAAPVDDPPAADDDAVMGEADAGDAGEGEGETSEASTITQAPAPQPVRAAPDEVRLRVDDDGLVEPLSVRTAVAGDVARWVLELRDPATGIVAWQQAGDGPPPSELSWDGNDDRGRSLLPPQSTWWLRLRVFGNDARVTTSAPVPVRVAGTEVRYLVNERVSGDMFARGRMDDALVTRLQAALPALRRTAPQPITIDAHLDDEPDQDDEVEVTQGHADQVARWLIEQGIDPGRITATGVGADRPLYPNIGDRTRQTNRRVEVRVVDPEPGVLAAPEAPPLPPAAFVANEREVAAGEGGRIEASLPRPQDGLVAAMVRLPDGTERAALVAVRPPADAPRGVDEARLSQVPVDIDVSGRRATVGGASTSLDALDLSLAFEQATAMVAGRRFATPVNLAVTGAPNSARAWTVEVFAASGALLWTNSGDGAPPDSLRWNGETAEGVAPVPGYVSARLTVRLEGGGLAASPPAFIEVLETADSVPSETVPEIGAETVVRVDGATLPAAGPWRTTTAAVTGRAVIVDVEHEGARVVLPITVPEGHGATLYRRLDLRPQVIGAPLAEPSAPSQAEPSTAPRDDAEDDAEDETQVPAQTAPDTSVDDREPRQRRGRRDADDNAGDDDDRDETEPSDDAPADEPAPPPTDPNNPFQPISQQGPDDPWLYLRPIAAPAMTFQIESTATVATEVADTTAPRFDELATFYDRQLDLALATDADLALAALVADAPASQIDVQLPPQGIALQSDRLSVFGTTHPDNRVFVNGVEVHVIDGAFSTVVSLPSGPSTLTVETRDEAGNRGLIEWPVEVADVRYFLMAIGDTAVGSRDADIAGRHDHNSIETDSGAVLYGQARVYFKGWMSGERVLDGFWDELEATAFVDTGRRREYEGFFRETIQPDRYYPVFGDSSEQVDDVNSRGKVYVLLTADDSTATFGNFQTDMEGVELFRYDRNLYGGQVSFDDIIADDYRTELRVHAADEDEQVQRTFDYLRGTGGSIYYLSRRQVVEGSERVTLVVRDRVSGVELARVPQSRNADYTIRYGEGRIIMKSPVPSVVDAAFMLGGYSTTRSTLQGHPVFVEVAYDYEGDTGVGDLSYGVYGRETLFDVVSVGGGYVEESRALGSDYTLWSVEAGVGATETTRVDVEYARSESDDLEYALSDDGGLTWGRFRLDDTDDEEGDALFVRGRFELADVIEAERDRIWNVEAYYDRRDRGFFSNGNVLDQGEEKFGVLSRWAVSEHHALSVRHDTVFSEVDDLLTEEDLDDTIEQERRVTTAQYDYTWDPAQLTLSWQRTYTDDQRDPDGYDNDILGAALGYQIARPLRLGVEQEIVARGEDPRLIRGTGDSATTRPEDRFITGVSANLSLGSDIEIAAAERFRYSGENSTIVGLRAAVSDDSDVYVQQRLTSFRDNHGTANTTVVGGEQRFGDDETGRSYGEYQVDSGVSGERSRAVLGFGKTFAVIAGLSFDLGYEHSQTLVDDSNDSENSRDTVSFGWNFLRLARVKASGLLELRFDHGSVHTPSTSACLRDDVSGNPDYCQDAISSVGDRRQIAWLTSIEWKATRDMTIMTGLDLIVTENQTLNVLEARDVEAHLGAAWRPVDVNWLNVLSRYTYLDEMAPYGLELDGQMRERSHVLSLSPIVELPWNLQLVEKVAWRGLTVANEGMNEAHNDLVLWINRINYHLTRTWDVSAEYRFLHQSLTGDWRHGTLLEINYILQDHVRLGVGYNFTRFAEDELGDFDRDASGVFFRVTAQY